MAIKPYVTPRLRDVASTKFRVLERQNATYLSSPDVRFYPQFQSRTSEEVTWLNFPSGDLGDRKHTRFASLEEAQAFLDEVVAASLADAKSLKEHPYVPQALRPAPALEVPPEPTYPRSQVAEILNRLRKGFHRDGFGPMVDSWTEGNCRAFQEAAQRCKAEVEKLYYVPPQESEDAEWPKPS